MNVLLVEPDLQLAATYSEYLRHSGYNVTAVGGGQQAVEAADLQVPGVVVLELELAGHNGIEFLHEFRSHRDWQDVPIIIHTMLPLKKLAQQGAALKEFNVRMLLSKSTTTLSQLKNSIHKIATT